MRRLTFALALLAAFALVRPTHATSLTPKLPLALNGDEGIATTDDARAMLFNPAALGLRYPDEAYFGFARRDGEHEWNTTLLQHRGMGFLALRQRDTSQTYGVAFAWGSEKLRFGWSPYWLLSGRPRKETVQDQRIGLLARPSPWFALGFTVDHLFQPIFRDERRARWYTVGVGVRPLALDRERAHGLGTRLTLGSEVTMVDDGEWRQARVRVTGQFEALPGIALRATVADHRNVQLGITLSGVRTTLGGGTSRERSQTLEDHGSLSLHRGEEPTILRGAGASRVAVVRVSGLLADESLGGVSLMGGGGGNSSRPIHRALERALEDPLTRGVLLELHGSGGMAQLEELRPRIQKLHQAGKPVVASLQYDATRGDLYLASACDRIVAGEEVTFGALGLRVEKRWYKTALADLGIKVDRSSYGNYKSAYREYSADSTPVADTVAIARSLNVSQALFLESVASGRRLTPERVAPFVDGRAYTTRDFVRGGLVDSIGYREDAVRLVGALTQLGPKPRLIDPLHTPSAHRPWTLPTPIAVVYASGGIEEGRSGNDLLTGPFMGDQTIVAQLERAFHAPGVRAVVLRIESPGGSALASNLIDHAVQRLKRETGKPLVVSMGSVAGSGGYYIACHADRIWADKYTRTGSVGVLFVKPSLEGFYAKHHVREDDFQRGDAMGGWSYAKDWTPAMQASADSSIRRTYKRFVDKVIESRHLEGPDVTGATQGRVWLGEDALEHKLIDGIGGLESAIGDARKRAGVAPGERIRLLEFGRPRPGFFARLVGRYVTDELREAMQVRMSDGAQARMDDPLEDATQ